MNDYWYEHWQDTTDLSRWEWVQENKRLAKERGKLIQEYGDTVRNGASWVLETATCDHEPGIESKGTPYSVLIQSLREEQCNDGCSYTRLCDAANVTHCLRDTIAADTIEELAKLEAAHKESEETTWEVAGNTKMCTKCGYVNYVSCGFYYCPKCGRKFTDRKVEQRW